MPTPTTAFADAAAKYGNVDRDDIRAVEAWFKDELPTLPAATIEEVLRELLEKDGAPEERPIARAYPEMAPLPSLRSSPGALPPLLAERWRMLLRRLFRGLIRR